MSNLRVERRRFPRTDFQPHDWLSAYAYQKYQETLAAQALEPAIVFKDVRIFFGGYEPTSQHNRLSLEFDVVPLEVTAFGDGTRVVRGGLKHARAAAAGYYAAGNNQVDPVYFDSLDLQDAVFMVFPQDVVEGSTSTGSGFQFKADLLRYSPVGQRHGDVHRFTVSAEGRGTGA